MKETKNSNEKTLKMASIVLAAALSHEFLYSGFTGQVKKVQNEDLLTILHLVDGRGIG